MPSRTLICLMLVLMGWLWPSTQAEPDRYLEQLLQQYPLEQARLHDLYATCGYVVLPLTEKYGHAMLECLSTMPVATLVITASRPQPFAELVNKFPLPDAVRIAYGLCEPNQELYDWQREIADCLGQSVAEKKANAFYTPDSPLLAILDRRVRFASVFEQTWAPGKKKALLEKLLVLSEEQRAQVRMSPLALPFLLATGDSGSKALQIGGNDFLYFLSLLQASEWQTCCRLIVADSKAFLAALEAYGLPAYHYWLKQGVVLEKLLYVFHDDSARLADFQKAVLFLHANRDTLRKYQNEVDFPDKVAAALQMLKSIAIPGSELTLAERSLVEPNLFRLAYEYPDQSVIPLAQFAGCQATLADLLYRGAMSPHIAVILQAMQHRGHAEMIYRGLLQYHTNDQLAAIIGKMGGRGMLVAINLDPNKYWHELLQEGHSDLHGYEILDNGTIKLRKPSAGTIEVLADQFLPVPLPLDLARLSVRLWKGYYVDTYDYLLAGVDIAKCTVAVFELLSTGQEEGTEIVDEWIRLAIKAAKTALHESSQYLERRKVKDKQQFGTQLFLRQVNQWLVQEQGKMTLQSHHRHLRNFIGEFASDNQQQEIGAEISQMQKELRNVIYNHPLPDRLKQYTFADYRRESRSDFSPAIAELSYYMLRNVAESSAR